MSTRPKSLLVTATLLATCSSTVAAAEPEETRLWPGVRWEKANRSTYVGINEFAACVVERRLVDVKTLLEFPHDSPKVDGFGTALASTSPGCLTIIAMRLSSSMFRGALIEALYKKDFGKGRPGEPSARLGEAGPQLELAKCIVRKSFVTSEELLKTLPASPAQKKVFQVLEPVVSSCVSTTGEEITRPQQLRFEIAEALYRARLDAGQAPESVR